MECENMYVCECTYVCVLKFAERTYIMQIDDLSVVAFGIFPNG